MPLVHIPMRFRDPQYIILEINLLARRVENTCIFWDRIAVTSFAK